MVGNNIKKDESFSNQLIKTGLLFISCVLVTFWFWPQYILFLHPVQAEAQIISLAPESITYKFYVPIEDKTFFFRRKVLLDESAKLKGKSNIIILYPDSMPNEVIIPALERPLPPWVFASVNLLVLFSFVLSLINLVRNNWRAK